MCRLTVAVYTCSQSCVPEEGSCSEGESRAHAEEFAFVQMPVKHKPRR